MTTPEPLPAADSTVNHVTREWPETLAVFRTFGVETCCGGGLPIAQAAQRAGADLTALLRALHEAVSAGV